MSTITVQEETSKATTSQLPCLDCFRRFAHTVSEESWQERWKAVRQIGSFYTTSVGLLVHQSCVDSHGMEEMSTTETVDAPGRRGRKGRQIIRRLQLMTPTIVDTLEETLSGELDCLANHFGEWTPSDRDQPSGSFRAIERNHLPSLIELLALRPDDDRGLAVADWSRAPKVVCPASPELFGDGAELLTSSADAPVVVSSQQFGEERIDPPVLMIRGEEMTYEEVRRLFRTMRAGGLFRELLSLVGNPAPSLDHPTWPRACELACHGPSEEMETLKKERQVWRSRANLETAELICRAEGEDLQRTVLSPYNGRSKPLFEVQREFLELNEVPLPPELQREPRIATGPPTRAGDHFLTPTGFSIHESCLSLFPPPEGAPDEEAPIFAMLEEALRRGSACLRILDSEVARWHLDGIAQLLDREDDLEPTIRCDMTIPVTASATASQYPDATQTTPDGSLIGHPFLLINPQKEHFLSDLPGTLFHELFHHLGHRHGVSVDYPYVCRAACFGDLDSSDHRLAAQLCSEPPPPPGKSLDDETLDEMLRVLANASCVAIYEQVFPLLYRDDPSASHLHWLGACSKFDDGALSASFRAHIEDRGWSRIDPAHYEGIRELGEMMFSTGEVHRILRPVADALSGFAMSLRDAGSPEELEATAREMARWKPRTMIDEIAEGVEPGGRSYRKIEPALAHYREFRDRLIVVGLWPKALAMQQRGLAINPALLESIETHLAGKIRNTDLDTVPRLPDSKVSASASHP